MSRGDSLSAWSMTTIKSSLDIPKADFKNAEISKTDF